MIATTTIAVIVIGMLGALGQGYGARIAADSAADLAALAGADAVVAGTGDPCTRAYEIAVVNGAKLSECTALGDGSVRVGTSVDLTGPLAGFGPVHSTARAGRPSDDSI